MYFVSLRSGSFGNGYFISDGKTTLLFDAGVPKKVCLSVLSEFPLPHPKALFISHEHFDHIKCLGTMLRTFKSIEKIVGTAGTIDAIKQNDQRLFIVKSQDELIIDDFAIRFIGKPHDAAEPIGFFIEHRNGQSFGIMSDRGSAAIEIIDGLRGAKVLLVEANHDTEMLWNGPYPEYLKRRIAGKFGHLSNEQCHEFIEIFMHPKLRTVILGHLSEKNNRPHLAYSCLRQHIPTSIDLYVASRCEPLILFYR